MHAYIHAFHVHVRMPWNDANKHDVKCADRTRRDNRMWKGVHEGEDHDARWEWDGLNQGPHQSTGEVGG